MTYPDDFEAFWGCYPRPQAKRDAFKAWQQTEQDRPPLPALLDALEAMCWSKEWRADDGKFIPLGATWLRRDGWEDKPTRVVPEAKAFEETMGGVDLEHEHQVRLQKERFEQAREGINPKVVSLLGKIGRVK